MRKLIGMFLGAAILAPAVVHAQTNPRGAVRTDARWYPWLGCWQSDSTDAGSGMKCIAPVSGSAAVDELTLIDGNIIARDRLDASGRPHQIREQGCGGSESVAWSATGRRVFLRADYRCATGINGTSTRIFALLPNGDWLEVENVQSGGGGIARAVRRHDVGVPSSLPREIAARLGGERLAVATARASSAAPITSDDVLEALHATDASTVRAWIVATNQRFDLDGRQVAALVNDDVPATVLQAMMAASPQRQLGEAPQGSAASDQYLSTPAYSPGAVQSTTIMNGAPMSAGNCVPGACYAPNAYSDYNGAGCYASNACAPYGYSPYGYSPYGYSPFGYSPFVPFAIYSAPIIVHRRQEPFRRPPVPRPGTHPVPPSGPHSGPHDGPHGEPHSGSMPRGPIGVRPSGGGGGRRP